MRAVHITTGLIVLALLGACSSTASLVERSQAYAADGNYYLAYKVLEEGRDANAAERDPELEAAYWQARLEYLVDQGRNNIFLDREEEALVDLNQAQVLAPDSEAIGQLVDRANTKLADRAARRGDEHLQKGELEQALLAFTESQRHVAGYPAALAGSQAVRAAFDQLHSKAQRHFLEALRKYPELRMIEVDWHTRTALESDPSREDVRDLKAKALRDLAERAYKRAQASESRALYGAALMEYRAAKDLNPDYPGIDQHIAHMERESRAERLVEKAFMHVLNGRYDESRKLLDEAFELTSMERSRVGELLLQTRKREALERYQTARDLELQGRKQQARDIYLALVEQWPNGLKDEKARADGLEIDITEAAKAYAAGAEAEAQEDFAAAAEHFAAAARSYAGYQDVQERLARVKARLQ